MGKQLVKIGKSLKDKNSCDDLVTKEEEDLVKTQKKGSRTQTRGTTRLASGKSFFNVKEDSKSANPYGNKDSDEERYHHRYEVNPDMVEHVEKGGPSLAAKDETGKRMEVKEDSVNSENSMKNIRFTCFINLTTSCIILLPITYNIKSVFLDKAVRISFTSSCCSTNYAAPFPPSFNESIKFFEINSEKKGKFITDEAVKTEEAFVNMIIMGCILILQIISVSSDMVAKFSTNYSSSSPRLDAKSCCSSTDGQTKSNSSPTVSPGKVQQVFVNFRGEELRYNFVSHLSDALERYQIKFFIDKKEERGKNLENLFVRIEESSIALAIFSTRYPESNWCMDELVKMKKLADKGKLRVIPIFYKVAAGDVKNQKGEFGENFWNKAKKSSGGQIKEWKEALESISHKMGLSLGDKRSEADFIKETVEEVQRVIKAIGLDEK